MKMCEKLQAYKEHLERMKAYCEGQQQPGGSGYWGSCANVWRLAGESMSGFFDKEDFQDEQATN